MEKYTQSQSTYQILLQGVNVEVTGGVMWIVKNAKTPLMAQRLSFLCICKSNQFMRKSINIILTQQRAKSGDTFSCEWDTKGMALLSGGFYDYLVGPAFECTIRGRLIGVTLPPLRQSFSVVRRHSGHAGKRRISKKTQEGKKSRRNNIWPKEIMRISKAVERAYYLRL